MTPHQVAEVEMLSCLSAGEKRQTMFEAAAAVHPDHFYTP